MGARYSVKHESGHDAGRTAAETAALRSRPRLYYRVVTDVISCYGISTLEIIFFDCG
jgi:hypothetical protein